jgi:Ca2+/Na+ antiporter
MGDKISELVSHNNIKDKTKKTMSGSKLTRLVWFFLMVITCLVYLGMIVFERESSNLLVGILLSFEFAVFVIVFLDRQNSRKVSLKFSEFEYVQEMHEKDVVKNG